MAETFNPDQLEQVKKLIEEQQKLAEQNKNLAQSYEQTSESVNNFSESTLNAGASTSSLYENVKKYAESVKQVGAFSKDQTESLSILNSALLRTNTTFNGSTEGLSTFSSQLSGLQQFINRDFNLDSLKRYVMDSPFKNLIDVKSFVQLGALKDKIMEVAKDMFTASDNALKLRQSYIATAASTGMLDDVLAKAGKNFENINLVIGNHQAALASAAKANGLNVETMSNLYNTLGKIPGFFKDATGAAEANTTQMDKLTKVVTLSLGLGRSQYDVIQDLTNAYRTYGAVGEGAFEFTTKISKITQNYDLELGNLQRSINSVASSFSKFTDAGISANNMLAGTANLYNQFIGAFKETGLTGDRATDVVNKMVGSINSLTLAQKSFLSAQTGGPGGLMGGLQIEQMLREGKVEEVFGKVRQQMERQLGNIVTLDEAARSPAAAAQFTRQRTMLMQSPLARFATTEDEASRVLEVFKGMQEGKGIPKEFEKDLLQSTLKSGEELQKQSYTQLSAINSSLDELKTSFFVPMLDITQKGFAARTGTTPGGVSESRSKMQAELEAQKEQAKTISRQRDQERTMLLDKTKELNLKYASGRQAYEGMESVVAGVRNVPNVISSAFDAFSSPFRSVISDFTSPGTENPPELRQAAQAQIQAAPTTPTTAIAGPEARPAPTTTATAGGAAAAAQQPSQQVEVKVDVNAVCTNCKEKIESQHVAAVNPATPKK